MNYQQNPAVERFDELEQEEAAPLFKTAAKLLRGRWYFAVPLAVLLGAAGLYGGYNLQSDQYTGVSTIELKPNLNVPVDVEDLQANESYRFFVGSQMRALRSLEVISEAMEQDEWLEAVSSRPADLPPVTVDTFSDKITLTEPARNETMLTVEFVDADPETARAGLNALFASYGNIHKQSRTEQIDEGLRLLTDQLRGLKTEKTNTEREIRTIIPGDEIGTISSRLESKLRELAAMEFRLSDIDLTLEPYLDAIENAETTQDVLSTDVEMQELLTEKKQWEDHYIYLTEVLERGDQMQDVKNVRRQLTMLDRQILELENKRIAAADSNDRKLLPPKVAELMGKRDVILKKIEELTVETSDLGWRISAAEEHKLKLEDIVESIRSTQAKISQYEDTMALSQNNDVSRIVIESPIQTPTMPSNTLRRYQLAGLGAVGGMAMGFGFIMLIGGMDRRVRHASDSVAGFPEVNVLGVLPTLPANLAEPEEAEAVAHSVHHIRTLLQIGGSNRVFSITSPTAGSGKSSLATALGLSFATSGVRTLVIDADLVGAGLSRRMGTVVHEPLDAVIRRNELLGEAELAQAMTLSASRQESIEQILLDEGLMDHEQVDTALRLQRDSSLSLLDACLPGRLRNCVAGAGIENFYILPVGRARPSDASKLSPSAMREMIHQAREAFDIVLIDTGPVLGSLEASIAAAEADATIVIVSRGDHKSLVARSIDQLRTVRAQIAGLVFNHALDRDLDHASYASLVSQERRPDRAARKKVLDKNRSKRLGPLGSAVASHTEE